MIIPVILCGGSGKRLWPISTEKRPKQFMSFYNNNSLLENTINRSNKISKNSTILIGSFEHKMYIQETLKSYKTKPKLFFEEIKRNTTAPICFAALDALIVDKNSKILIMPSDHYISDDKYFEKVIVESQPLLESFNWVIFGIKPNMPSTAYGYIKTIKKDNKYLVKNFEEKPNKLKANKYLKDKNYYWNSGIFFGYAHKILDSIKLHSPDIFQECKIAWKKKKILSKSYFFRKEILNKIRSESIDYAVLEKEKSLGFKELKCKWSDLGSWDSIADLEKFSDKKSVGYKNLIESDNNFIFNDKKNISIVGAKDLIIIQEKNEILIIKKGESEKVKLLSDVIDKKRR